ncbi:MAG: PQQ-binding-like beta-propeller repeat protein [Clostridiales bacterium]|nr:PQQ-binding-like beta-propeller repeat protein [Clostridiales bacterium]
MRKHARPRASLYRALLLPFALFTICFACQSLADKNTQGAPLPTLPPRPTAESIIVQLTATPPATPAPTPEPTPFATAVADSRPENRGFVCEVEYEGRTVEEYRREEPISLTDASEYSYLPGVLTFRANNFRGNAAYGVAEISEQKLKQLWNVPTRSLPKGISSPESGSWTGNGWTGQPLLVQWPRETKDLMNMHAAAIEKDELVEVIYAAMDGYIYFLDLETGAPTRDKLSLGVPFKGAGSLDPRGYPLLYLGSGDMYASASQKSRVFIVSLTDGSVLYEFGKDGEEKFAHRAWHCYDSAPIVDAATDTLIYPGENGLLYTLRLHTAFDPDSGRFSVTPDEIVKMRYSADRTRSGKFKLGYEGSCAAYAGYAYLSDNSGLFQCVDLNRMSVVWVQDLRDDTNASPALELTEDGEAYLYVGATVDATAKNGRGKAGVYKLDARNGSILWQYDREVYTGQAITGGAMGSPVLGEQELSDLVFFNFASVGSGVNEGWLLAFDRATGELLWNLALPAYTWSSPLALYDASGRGYLIQCDRNGNILLIDGRSGEICDKLTLGGNMEASPSAFNNILVIGTRTKGIFGVRID